MDPILAILSVLGYGAIVLGTLGGAGTWGGVQERCRAPWVETDSNCLRQLLGIAFRHLP